MSNTDKNVDVLQQAAELILAGKTEDAGAVIQKNYPFTPIDKDSRSYSKTEQMKQFFKDGFIDRYFGTKLINPGMLRLLSGKLPKEFPYHPNWNTEVCHMAYWDYTPTMDHIHPISRGGRDDPSNWVTTSMKGNSAKSNYTMEQLHFTLVPEGDIHEWDGLSRLFIEIVEKYPELKQLNGVKDWYGPTKHVMEEYCKDLLPDRRIAVNKEPVSQKIVSANNRYFGADKQSFLDDIRNHSESLSETVINTMSDILSTFERAAKRYNVRLVYSRAEKSNRILAILKNNEKKSVLAEYSNGEIWATNLDNYENDDVKIYIRSVLTRLIAEKIFNKTTKNLSATQWGIMLTGSKRDTSIDKQIIRFAEILKEELK